MIPSHRLRILFAFFLLFSLSASSQGFLRASGTRIVNDKGPVLLRGIGLGGWMLQEGYMLRVNRDAMQHRIRERIDSLIGPERTEEFYNAWLDNFVRKRDIDSLHAWGFNSIRLPMHFNLYTLPVDKEPVAGQQTWLEKGFQLTDSLLAWCKARRMYLILDLHAAPGGQGNDLNIADRDPNKPSLWDSEANRAKTIALWKKLAERYVNEPWIGGYDILNEPNWGFEDPAGDRNGTKEKTNAPLRALLVDITKAIRSVDNKHIIIIEGNGWGNNYNGMLPQWDKNMVLSFHKYWNYNDLGSIQHMLDTREKYQVPIWLGETGENSNVWFTQAVSLFEDHEIGWAWWPLKKMGANNPLEIPSNPNYDQIVNYWAGRGRKPNESNAYSGLLELATYTRLENNRIHRDVIDALIRQPHTTATLPFKPHSVKNGTLIQAVDYDLGRNGFAYYDTDSANYRTSNGPQGGNKGRVYRNDAVDIRKDSAAYEKYYVSDIEDGEWLQYTVQVPAPGTYDLELRVSGNGGAVSILWDGNETRPSSTVPSTSGEKTWTSIRIKTPNLTAGKHTLRVRVDKGGFNFSSLRFHSTK